MREIWVHNTVARMIDNDENNLVSGRYLTVANMQEVAYSLLPTDTASGAVASFPDGADDVPIISLVANVEPVQDLHGYENPWPAGGGVNKLDASANNLIDFTASYRNYTYADGVVLTTGNTLMGFIAKVSPSTEYAASFVKTTGSCNMRIREFSAIPTAWDDDNFIEQTVNGSIASKTLNAVRSFTTTAETEYIIFALYTTQAIEVSKWQLELGSDATAWKPYDNVCPISGWTATEVNVNGETIAHEFKDAQGNTLTVYGGEDELVRGKLKVTRGVIDSYAGENIGEPWISSLDAYTPGGTPTTGAQVVYTLAAPIEYDLTAEDIRTLLGDNTIFADCGDVEVTYRADMGLYIDKKLASQNAALTNSMNNITVLDTVKAAFKKRG